MRRLFLPLALVAVCAAWGSGPAGRPLDGYGVSLRLPPGWHGVAAPGQLQAADFRLSPAALALAESVHVQRGHLHVIVWDYGPAAPYLRNFRSARTPLAIRPRDLTRGPLEGFSSADVYAARTVRVGEELLEILVDLGPRPLAARQLHRANEVLATLRVRPPRVLLPRAGRLSADGISVRLPAGWSGRLEIPSNRRSTRLVLRARRGDIRLVLLELPGVQGRHEALPVELTSRDVHQVGSLAVARQVFSTGGSSFDLSAVIGARSDLARVNRLLATLVVAPRPWTFRACDLSLRLSGTWWAAIKPRDHCYPVITLRGPGIRVILTELRPTDHAGGHVLRRSGRRFVVEVAPPSAEPRADAVLGTLRVG
jgi:hypothetical protein